jgi:hypothetical protein
VDLIVRAFQQIGIASATNKPTTIIGDDIGDNPASLAPADFPVAAHTDAVVEEKLITAGAGK